MNPISVSEMDFHSLKRKELQALCKKHSIPANLTNLEMANKLTSLLKENEKPMTRKSCLKNIDEEESEKDSDGVIRQFKKVRFSPDTETIDLLGLKDAKPVEIRRGRPARAKKVGFFVDNVDRVEISTEIGENPVRTTRARAQKIADGGVLEVVLPPIETKRARRGVRSDSVDLLENLASGSADLEETAVPTKRSLRNNREALSKNDKEVEEDVVVLKKNQALRSSKKRNVKTSEEISEDNVLALGSGIAQPEQDLRKSKRNVRMVENYALLNRDLGKNEKVGGGRAISSRTQLEENASDAVSGMRTETKVELHGKLEVVLQLEEPSRRPSRYGNRRKSVMPQIENLATDGDEADIETRKTLKGSVLEQNDVIRQRRNSSRRKSVVNRRQSVMPQIEKLAPDGDEPEIENRKQLKGSVLEEGLRGENLGENDARHRSSRRKSVAISDGIDRTSKNTGNNMPRKRKRDPILVEESVVNEGTAFVDEPPKRSTRNAAKADPTATAVAKTDTAALVVGRKKSRSRSMLQNLDMAPIEESTSAIQELPILVAQLSMPETAQSATNAVLNSGEVPIDNINKKEESAEISDFVETEARKMEISVEITASKSVKLQNDHGENETLFSVSSDEVVEKVKVSMVVDKEKPSQDEIISRDISEDDSASHSSKRSTHLDSNNLVEPQFEPEQDMNASTDVSYPQGTSGDDSYSLADHTNCMAKPSDNLDKKNEIEKGEEPTTDKGIDGDKIAVFKEHDIAELGDCSSFGEPCKPKLVIEGHLAESHDCTDLKENAENAYVEAGEISVPSISDRERITSIKGNDREREEVEKSAVRAEGQESANCRLMMQKIEVETKNISAFKEPPVTELGLLDADGASNRALSSTEEVSEDGNFTRKGSSNDSSSKKQHHSMDDMQKGDDSDLASWSQKTTEDFDCRTLVDLSPVEGLDKVAESTFETDGFSSVYQAEYVEPNNILTFSEGLEMEKQVSSNYTHSGDVTVADCAAGDYECSALKVQQFAELSAHERVCEGHSAGPDESEGHADHFKVEKWHSNYDTEFQHGVMHGTEALEDTLGSDAEEKYCSPERIEETLADMENKSAGVLSVQRALHTGDDETDYTGLEGNSPRDSCFVPILNEGKDNASYGTNSLHSSGEIEEIDNKGSDENTDASFTPKSSLVVKILRSSEHNPFKDDNESGQEELKTLFATPSNTTYTNGEEASSHETEMDDVRLHEGIVISNVKNGSLNHGEPQEVVGLTENEDEKNKESPSATGTEEITDEGLDENANVVITPKSALLVNKMLPSSECTRLKDNSESGQELKAPFATPAKNTITNREESSCHETEMDNVRLGMITSDVKSGRLIDVEQQEVVRLTENEDEHMSSKENPLPTACEVTINEGFNENANVVITPKSSLGVDEILPSTDNTPLKDDNESEQEDLKTLFATPAKNIDTNGKEASCHETEMDDGIMQQGITVSNVKSGWSNHDEPQEIVGLDEDMAYQEYSSPAATEEITYEASGENAYVDFTGASCRCISKDGHVREDEEIDDLTLHGNTSKEGTSLEVLDLNAGLLVPPIISEERDIDKTEHFKEAAEGNEFIAEFSDCQCSEAATPHTAGSAPKHQASGSSEKELSSCELKLAVDNVQDEGTNSSLNDFVKIPSIQPAIVTDAKDNGESIEGHVHLECSKPAMKEENADFMPVVEFCDRNDCKGLVAQANDRSDASVAETSLKKSDVCEEKNMAELFMNTSKCIQGTILLEEDSEETLVTSILKKSSCSPLNFLDCGGQGSESHVHQCNLSSDAEGIEVTEVDQVDLFDDCGFTLSSFVFFDCNEDKGSAPTSTDKSIQEEKVEGDVTDNISDEATDDSEVEENVKSFENFSEEDLVGNEDAPDKDASVGGDGSLAPSKPLCHNETKSIAQEPNEFPCSLPKFEEMVHSAGDLNECGELQEVHQFSTSTVVNDAASNGPMGYGTSGIGLESNMFSSWEINLFLGDEVMNSTAGISETPFTCEDIAIASVTKENANVILSEEQPSSHNHFMEGKILEQNGSCDFSDDPIFEVYEFSEEKVVAEVSNDCRCSVTESVEVENLSFSIHDVNLTEVSNINGNEPTASVDLKVESSLKCPPEGENIANTVLEDDKPLVEVQECEESLKGTELCEADLKLDSVMEDQPSDLTSSDIAAVEDAEMLQPNSDMVKMKNPQAKAEECDIAVKQLNSTTMKTKYPRSSLIQGTPKKLIAALDMKENAPSIKRGEHARSITVKSKANRHALGDLQNN